MHQGISSFAAFIIAVLGSGVMLGLGFRLLVRFSMLFLVSY